VIGRVKSAVQSSARKLGVDVVRYRAPVSEFHSDAYLRHNARRLEHLASLRLPVAGRTVLEVGAGIGDHSHYYLDRGCAVTITEARSENLDFLRQRYPDCDVRHLDLEEPELDAPQPFDVVHCYGLLYHLKQPEAALAFLAEHTGGVLLLETCVSYGADEAVHPTPENRANPSQAVSGMGCRPTRGWIWGQLERWFEHVYLPRTQPNHEQFPVDWARAGAANRDGLTRAVFVASRRPIENEALVHALLDRQTRHA